MRIGLFTDVYHPSTNGVTFVVDILRDNLKLQGHEVYIVAPTTSVRRSVQKRDPHVIRFTAIKGIMFEEQLTSIFFPPRQVRKIASLKLDAVIFFTPSQIGFLGVYSAKKLKIPLVWQYTTDLIEYIERYPFVMVGAVALFLSLLPIVEFRRRDILQITKSIGRSSDRSLSRKQDMLQKMLTILLKNCDATVAVSTKVSRELRSWGVSGKKVYTVATGVDRLPVSKGGPEKFRRKWDISTGDIVVLYVGRLGKEKNLELLINAFAVSARDNPALRLVMAGDFSYRETLEIIANRTGAADSIRFTGRLDRRGLGDVYAGADIFCFPSLTDTQALVLNEAAHAGLPLIWCDGGGLNDVLVHRRTGLLASSSVGGLASAITKLAGSPELRKSYGDNAKVLAAGQNEPAQTKKLIDVLQNL